ncbi:MULTISPECIES: lipopolysaccharide assembly protein LapB [Methyloversatilis]|jgi:lipopolysaccharide assembly protein B|uniref:lipopolysaccharide assembly protein LapB n=1 Tax=Methyloversatilis TaxID=378210 RepID=UPI00036E4923|nr:MULTISPECIES: lipopolysaccharide assembly protein LapB [Methyloversatilis]MCR6665792.1 lipopolysaccharide assembly protein LapB [Methyloversatilis sp.]PZU52232.1 MAG: lipopolysaccharide assembly protein LapB [Thauera sp.]
MEIELWWLLALPLFFGLGWLAARIDIRHLVRESRALPRSYFAGLNFLLNEQPDRAIDSFIEATSKDPQTVELQFALGNLFRRRGETDRAIQIHQALAAREDVRAEQRLNARLELGLDFLKAGLLDRAEETFVGLRGSAVDIEALHHLLDIYQQEKEWHKAIDIARALPENESHRAQKDIAQFLCELATQALAQSRMGDARSLLGEALATHRKCVRALMLLGDAAAAEQKWEEAIEHWQRIEQQNPVYLALVASRMADAYRKLGRERQGITLLKSYLERHASLDLLDVVFKEELDTEGPTGALTLVREELRRNPTLLGLDKLLEAQMQTLPPEARTDSDLMKNIIHAHTRRVARYRCDSCGFKARQFHWRCPACGGWETYPPKRTEEFDLTP